MVGGCIQRSIVVSLRQHRIREPTQQTLWDPLWANKIVAVSSAWDLILVISVLRACTWLHDHCATDMFPSEYLKFKAFVPIGLA